MPKLTLPPYMTASEWDEYRDEGKRFRKLTETERSKLLEGMCAAAADLLRAKTDAERRRLAEYEEPLPESTRLALERLRREYAQSRHTEDRSHLG